MRKRRLSSYRSCLSREHARLLGELQLSQYKYRVLIDDNLIGAAVTSLSGEVKDANDAFLKMIGYSREELMAGQARWDTVTDPNFIAFEIEQGKLARLTGRSVYEKEYIRRDGTRIPVLLAYSLLGNEAFCFAIDLTEQKHAQRQLREAIRAREDFLSIASHELKTPLTTLYLQLGLLRRLVPKDGAAVDTRQLTGRLDGFEDQLMRLGTLVDSLLDVTRIRGNRLSLNYSQFDFRALAQEVVERFVEDSNGKRNNIFFQSEGPVHGAWDKMRVDQIITNLLLNAVKYGDGGRIDVHLASTPEHVTLQVKDCGIGISLEDQARVFDRFERAASHNYGGLGLGLYITKRIVERHSGRIWVESGVQKGSTFFVELPIQQQEQQQPQQQPNLRGLFVQRDLD